MSPSTSTHSSQPAPTFGSLGVRPIINCRGTYTILSGSRLLPVAAQAMVQASDHYVHMDELTEAVGRRLAELSGAEWGYVATGCAAAMAEIAAAAITGGDPERMARLPDITGMANEIIIQAGHVNSYSRSLTMTGARLVTVVTLADLEAAISPRTALLVATGDQHHLGQIPIQTMIDLAHQHLLPCLVDAAAERPDVPNVYLELGADAVTYSGGKCLRGPQASGLALGRRGLLWAAYLNGAPHHSLGRPMKAGKEEIMGLLAAFEAWVLGRDHEKEWRTWESYLETIRQAFADLPSLETHIVPPGVANVAPMLHLSWDPQRLGHTYTGIHQALWAGEPRIAVHLLDDGLRIMPYMMEEGDDRVVADKLGALLREPPVRAITTPAAPPAVGLSSDWIIDIAFSAGATRHSAHWSQQGSELSGHQRTPYQEAPITGQVTGECIAYSIQVGVGASQTLYRFEGRVCAPDSLQGTLTIGEFGQATWSARRCRPAASAELQPGTL